MIDFSSSFFQRSNFDPDFIRNCKSIKDWIKLDDEFNKWLTKKNNTQQKIPKIIHQIWLGGTIPNKYVGWTQSWLAFNPEYEYIFWDDNNVKNLEITNLPFYKKQENKGAKSDILRYAILNQYGGIYADTDFECLRSIPANLHYLSGFAGLVYGMNPQVNNALIGSQPNSLILKQILDRFRSTSIHHIHTNEAVLKTTGPEMFTDVLFNNFCDIEQFDFLILPNVYFYPHPKYIPFVSLSSSKLVTSDTFATHHWDCSWMKPTLFQRIKRKIKAIIK